MDPHKIKKKKYPITYVGHCDFDLRTENYPCEVAYPQGPCLPVVQGEIGGCHAGGNYPGVMEDYMKGTTITPGTPDSFSGWFFPIFFGLGGFGTAAAALWDRLKRATTTQDKHDLMEKAYNCFHDPNCEMTEDEYRMIMLYASGTSASDLEGLMWKTWWKKYKYFVLGGGALFLTMFMFKGRR